MNEHLTAAQLVRVAGDEVPPEERQAILSHLEACEPCGDRLAAILLLRQQGRRRWAPVYALAAGAAVVTLAAVLWLLVGAGGSVAATPPLPAERQAAVERWAAFASTENIEPEVYDFLLRVLYPEAIPVAPDQYVPLTRTAVIDLRDGRYDAAVDQLSALYLQHPDFDSLAGWLGIALHLRGDTDPLVQSLLDRGRRSHITTLTEMSLWYGAHQYLLAGRPSDAVPLLTELARHNTHIGRLGRSLLAEMPLEELALTEDGRVPST